MCKYISPSHPNDSAKMIPFTLLKINNTVGNKTAMTGTGTGTNSCGIKILSIGVGLIHSLVICTCGTLQRMGMKQDHTSFEEANVPALFP